MDPEIRNATTEVDLVRKMVRGVFWNIAYHEQQLKFAHRKVAMIKSVLQQADLGCTVEHALEIYNDYEEDGDGDEPTDSVSEFAHYWYGDALHSIEWHEDELRNSSEKIAIMKALLIRGNFTEIDMKKEEQEARARYFNHNPDDSKPTVTPLFLVVDGE